MLKVIAKFLKAINENSNPGEIAHAVSIAFILGLLPKNNVFWYVLAFFFFFIRINKGTYILFTFLFSLLAPLLDPFFDKIGYFILTLPAFENFFANMLEIPFVSFTKFNNTIVMGSLFFSIIMYIPLYFLVRGFLKLWRKVLSPTVRKLKIVVILSKVPIFTKISNLMANI